MSEEPIPYWPDEEGHQKGIKPLGDLIQESLEKYGPPSGSVQKYEPQEPTTIEFHIRSGYIICNVLFGDTWRTSSWRDDITILEFLMNGQMGAAHDWPKGRDFKAIGE